MTAEELRKLAGAIETDFDGAMYERAADAIRGAADEIDDLNQKLEKIREIATYGL